MYKHPNGQEYKVVICTPSGRQKYLDIFKKFIYRKMEERLIDGWQIWQNTVNPPDIDYLASMAAENPKVKVYKIDEPITPTWKFCNPVQTYKFFKYAHDDDTIYIRFDDDIVWCEEGAIEKICKARIDVPDAFLIYPNIINSTICTAWHQQIGALSEEAGVVRKEIAGNYDWDYLDEFNYTDSKLIWHIYQTFKKRYNENSLSAYYLPNKSFSDYKHFSICSIAWWGKDKLAPGPIEEPQLSWELPMEFQRPVFFVGNALMFHASYHTQEDALDAEHPERLDFFKEITK